MAAPEQELPRVNESQELSAAPNLTSPEALGRANSQGAASANSEGRRNQGWAYRFNNPEQIKPRDYWIVRIVGRVGWCAKGLVYGLIGGMCCQSAVGDDETSVSPQGAFILVGSNTIGIPLLIVLAIALITYCIWRFWEAVTGQGADAAFGNMKNFFRYRLSPFVSGIVYALYTVFVISLITKNNDDRSRSASNSNFPDSWTHSTIGKVGLCFAGIAFLAAFLVQIEGTLTRNFHETLRPGMPAWLKWWTWITGHLGFLARGGVFMCVAILFFRAVQDQNASHRKTAIGDALDQLKSSRGGKAGLFILGTGLIIYAMFAVLNGFYVREFPTRVPSGVPHGQKTPMAHAVSTMITKASFRRRPNSSRPASEKGDGPDVINMTSNGSSPRPVHDIEMGAHTNGFVPHPPDQDVTPSEDNITAAKQNGIGPHAAGDTEAGHQPSQYSVV